jgi:GDPmannose 4,6-dehydratase
VKKRALITGVSGMDGSHLAEHLISLDYEVYGTVRFTSNLKNIKNFQKDINLLYGDITDQNFIYKTILQSQPDEIYHLAAISYSAEIWENPISTYNIDAISVVQFLEAIKNINPKIKFLACSSSEIYDVLSGGIDESVMANPSSPYGIAKLFAQNNIKMYRDKYNLFCCSTVLFNHESERRSENFVTKKISSGLANIYLKGTKKIILGDISSRKDWGYSPEYVNGMHKMLQINEPEDFILANQSLVSVEEIIKHGFKYVNIENWQDYIEIDQSISVNRNKKEIYGIIDKAKEKLNWYPETSIYSVIEKMIDFDIEKTKISNKIFIMM